MERACRYERQDKGPIPFRHTYGKLTLEVIINRKRGDEMDEDEVEEDESYNDELISQLLDVNDEDDTWPYDAIRGDTSL